MRAVGGALRASGFGVQDHVSWGFDDHVEFRDRVLEFLSDGFELGLRCVYAGEGTVERLRADLAELPGVDDHLRRGALAINALGDLYPEGAAIDPGQTLAAFDAATEDALALGYAGLRVAADSTSLVRTPDQLAAFTEWEHLADRYMAEHPFSGLCGFDRTRLPASTTIALASLHPASREGTTPFRIYSPGHDAHLALAGELDLMVADDFRTCLERTALHVPHELVVDGTGLDFVDHRALEAIRDFARRFDATALFRTRSSTPGRLIELLGIDGIRAVAAEGVT